MHACMHAHSRTRTNGHVRPCMRTHIYIRARTHTHTHAQVLAFTCARTQEPDKCLPYKQAGVGPCSLLAQDSRDASVTSQEEVPLNRTEVDKKLPGSVTKRLFRKNSSEDPSTNGNLKYASMDLQSRRALPELPAMVGVVLCPRECAHCEPQPFCTQPHPCSVLARILLGAR